MNAEALQAIGSVNNTMGKVSLVKLLPLSC